MKRTTSRIIIENIVQKTLRDISDSPERSTRNLVDMALHFSEGRFQRNFFEAAQTMLQNEQSPYYALVKDTVSHVDHERILQLGMNLGYHSCTIGGERIRAIEKQDGFNIPWTIFLKLNAQYLLQHTANYQNLFFQGENLGIYTWMIFSDQYPEEFFHIVSSHPDSAFLLFCDEDSMDEPAINELSKYNHVLPVIRFNEAAAYICSKLRRRSLPYALFHIYNDSNFQQVTTGTLFQSAEILHPIFTVLLPSLTSSADIQKQVYFYLKQVRTRQLFQTIVYDFIQDSLLIDGIISNDACLACLDIDGQLFIWDTSPKETPYNCFQYTLREVFKMAYTKNRPVSNGDSDCVK